MDASDLLGGVFTACFLGMLRQQKNEVLKCFISKVKMKVLFVSPLGKGHLNK